MANKTPIECPKCGTLIHPIKLSAKKALEAHLRFSCQEGK